MKKLKRLLSLILSLTLILTLLPVNATAASSYSASKSLEYAKGHWDDGKGRCAEFVSNCLKAGGLTSWNQECTNLYNQLNKEVVNGAKIASVQHLTVSGNYIKVSQNAGKVSKGDVLFWYCSYCKAHPEADSVGGPHQHTALISDVSGTYVKVYQHNNAMNNEAAWVGTCYVCGSRYSDMVLIHFGASSAASADPTVVEFTSMTYPTALTKGQSYALQGTIKSNSNITKIIAAIKQSGKQVKACTIENVNSTTFKITGNSTIASKLDFASLSEGSYSVKYAVYNSAGGFEEWEKDFTVETDKTAVEFTGMTYPTTLTKGQSYTLQGTIKSNSNITKIIAAIKQSGKQVKACTIENVNSTTFKITGNSTITNKLDFASLSEGSYSVKYAVYNSAGGFKEWEKSFNVVAPTHTHTLSHIAAMACPL